MDIRASIPVCFDSHDFHVALEKNTHTHTPLRLTGGRRHSPGTKQSDCETGRFCTRGANAQAQR